MKEKIIVIGSGGLGGTASMSKMKELGEELIVVYNAEQLDELMKDKGIDFNKPIPYVNPYSNLPKINEHGYYEKEFVCKGKHQYREKKVQIQEGLIQSQWICQCGRNMND